MRTFGVTGLRSRCVGDRPVVGAGGELEGAFGISFGGARRKDALLGWRASLSAVTGVYSSVGSVPWLE
jgi:hypothetical protein